MYSSQDSVDQEKVAKMPRVEIHVYNAAFHALNDQNNLFPLNNRLTDSISWKLAKGLKSIDFQVMKVL